MTGAAGAPRVAIVGGGLGGLTLAQGLRLAGVDVTVYERDPSAQVRGQGYRLHIDAHGAGALRLCLPPLLYQQYARTTYRPVTDTPRITVLSKNLRQLRVIELPAGDPELATGAVDRQVLRDILRTGLDERLRFGWEFTGYEVGGGAITLRFADGRTATTDILVGADGVGSRVRRQYLPHAVVRDTGERCVYGRTPLCPEVDALLPEATRHGFVAVVEALRSRGMAVGVMRFPGGDGSYVMWALTARERAFGPGAFGPDLAELPGPGLTERVERQIRRWHPAVRALVARCDPDRTAMVPIRVAEPVPPWPSTNVTLLGDAIHAMSPAGGSGANTALRDAGLLCRTLGTGTLQGYETAMLEYGFAAVAASRTG